MNSTLFLGENWWQRNRITFKIVWLGLLALILQVPLVFVDVLLRERRQRRDEAVREVSRMWGGHQRLLGPVVVVPYVVETEEVAPAGTAAKAGRQEPRRRVQQRHHVCFLPERLEVEGQLQPEVRQRGIYGQTVYAGKLKLTGHFAPFKWTGGNPAPDELLWSQAYVALGLGDLRGMREDVALQWGGRRLAWQAGARLLPSGAGLHATGIFEGAPPSSPVPFSVEFTLNGSERFECVPVGRETTVRIASSWPDPGFIGGYLPVERDVTAAGFKAAWSVSHFSRGFAQQWTTRPGDVEPRPADFEAAAVGVTLLRPIDAYRTTERALKHGLLFIVLVFTAFFIFETATARRLHGLHYLLVGAALCLFYLALLSLSEFVGFGLAYAIAALASTGLVGGYAITVFAGVRHGAFVSVGLALVYAYLYFVLQMQDYALLAGTGALFVALAAVMWATRHVGAPSASEA